MEVIYDLEVHFAQNTENEFSLFSGASLIMLLQQVLQARFL